MMSVTVGIGFTVLFLICVVEILAGSLQRLGFFRREETPLSTGVN